jgi:hypothetical protein
VFLVFLVCVLGIWFEVTGLADLISPRSGSLNGPEVFWFHPVELGKEGFLLLITALKVIPKRLSIDLCFTAEHFLPCFSFVLHM